MKLVRILIADDHEIVRRGLRALLQDRRGWEIVAEAVNGREAVNQARRLKPDVAVLDISMPELNGLDATRAILQASPATEVLILTMHESDRMLKEVVAAGARAYVLKSDAARDLVAAVESLAAHRPFFTQSAAQIAVMGQRAHTISNGPIRPRLTPRERAVVQLLVEGRSNKEVAAALGIRPKTVETHRANVMRKLQIHSLAELVRYAIRERISEA